MHSKASQEGLAQIPKVKMTGPCTRRAPRFGFVAFWWFLSERGMNKQMKKT